MGTGYRNIGHNNCGCIQWYTTARIGKHRRRGIGVGDSTFSKTTDGEKEIETSICIGTKLKSNPTYFIFTFFIPGSGER